MNTVHWVTGYLFDLILAPFGFFGSAVSLVLASGIFGIAALLVFKRISWQGGIKHTKDKIKGHMIAIRIYQDDLSIVMSSVGGVLLRNLQYLGLNFGPILPLFVPFLLMASQLVVRYAFAPLPIMDEGRLASWVPGRETMLEVRMKVGRESEVLGLSIGWPPMLKALSPLARNTRDGVAVVEFGAVESGTEEIHLRVNGKEAGGKVVAAGRVTPRLLQPERVSGFWDSWLWPAEPTLPKDSPIDTVRFSYPNQDLGYLPGGPFGVLLTFFLSSMVFGIALLRPLNIQI